MQFEQQHLQYFDASDGAYSPATDNEIEKSQITATDYEFEVFLKHYGPDGIHRGNVGSDKKAASKTFRLHPSGAKIELNLIFPKPQRDELRLYLRKDSFKPREGAVWYLFVRDDEMWLGQMSQSVWDSRFLDDAADAETNLLDDDTSADFQQILNDQGQDAPPVPDLILRSGQSFARSAKIARDAIQTSGFKCEIEPTYPTFISRVTAKPYVEAHHFIPMGLQGHFDTSLDVEANICVLNPTIHRMLHSGIPLEVAPAIEQLFARREEFINSFGLVLDDIKNIYLRV